MSKEHRYMAMSPNYWGGGDSIKAAKAQMRRAGWSRSAGGYVVVELDPPCTITTDPVSGPCLPTGTSTTIVEDKRRKSEVPA